jgi:antitoxin ParD1/3/4
MQISLPSELEELVKNNVATGVYASADDVICAALHLWKEHTDYLKAEISKGIDEADQKIFSSMSLEDLKAEARRRLNQKH